MRRLFLLLALLLVGCPTSPTAFSAAGFPAEFCAGAVLPAALPAIFEAPLSTERYATALLGAEPPFCTAVIIGPRLVLTAAHCVDAYDPGPPVVYPNQLPEADRLRVHVGLSFPTTTTTYTVDDFIVHPDSDKLKHDSVFGPPYYTQGWWHDIAILHTDEDLPGPYAAFYDSKTQAASCTGLILQGAAPSDSPNPPLVECLGTDTVCLRDTAFYVYDVGQLETVGGETAFRVQGDTPLSAACPGDSGGPLYAVVGGTEYLAGVSSRGTCEAGGDYIGIKPIGHTDWITREAPNLGPAMRAWPTPLSWTPSSIDVTAAAATARCAFRITLNAAYGLSAVTCTAVSPSGTTRHSCTARPKFPEGGFLGCDVTIPKGSESGDWAMNLHAATTTGESKYWHYTNDNYLGSDRVLLPALTVASTAPDTTEPSVTGFTRTCGGVEDPCHVSSATGGQVLCDIAATDAGSGVRDMHCAWAAPAGTDKASCTTRPGETTCHAVVAPGSSVGVWALKEVIARDYAGNVKTMTGAEIGAIPADINFSVIP